MQARAVTGPIERSAPSKPTPGGPITPVHDLNVPYEGTEEYETPTADLLFPPVITSLSLLLDVFPEFVINNRREFGNCRRHCRLQFKPLYQELLTTRCIIFLLDPATTLLLELMLLQLLPLLEVALLTMLRSDLEGQPHIW